MKQDSSNSCLIGVNCPCCGHITGFHCRYDEIAYIFVCQMCGTGFLTDLEYVWLEEHRDHSFIVEAPDIDEEIKFEEMCMSEQITWAHLHGSFFTTWQSHAMVIPRRYFSSPPDLQPVEEIPDPSRLPTYMWDRLRDLAKRENSIIIDVRSVSNTGLYVILNNTTFSDQRVVIATLEKVDGKKISRWWHPLSLIGNGFIKLEPHYNGNAVLCDQYSKRTVK